MPTSIICTLQALRCRSYIRLFWWSLPIFTGQCYPFTPNSICNKTFPVSSFPGFVFRNRFACIISILTNTSAISSDYATVCIGAHLSCQYPYFLVYSSNTVKCTEHITGLPSLLVPSLPTPINCSFVADLTESVRSSPAASSTQN